MDGNKVCGGFECKYGLVVNATKCINSSIQHHLITLCYLVVGIGLPVSKEACYEEFRGSSQGTVVWRLCQVFHLLWHQNSKSFQWCEEICLNLFILTPEHSIQTLEAIGFKWIVARPLCALWCPRILAQKGIQAGDLLLNIGGNDCKGMPFQRIPELVKTGKHVFVEVGFAYH